MEQLRQDGKSKSLHGTSSSSKANGKRDETRLLDHLWVFVWHSRNLTWSKHPDHEIKPAVLPRRVDSIQNLADRKGKRIQRQHHHLRNSFWVGGFASQDTRHNQSRCPQWTLHQWITGSPREHNVRKRLGGIIRRKRGCDQSYRLCKDHFIFSQMISLSCSI